MKISSHAHHIFVEKLMSTDWMDEGHGKINSDSHDIHKIEAVMMGAGFIFLLRLT